MARYVLSGPISVVLLDGAPVDVNELEVPSSAELESIEGFATVGSLSAEATISGHAARRLRQVLGWALGPARCRRRYPQG